MQIAKMKQGIVLSAIAAAMAVLGWVTPGHTGAMAATTPDGYNCLTREVFTPEKRAWCDRWKKLQAATLIVPDGLDASAKCRTVTLNGGRYQQDDGKFFVELVNEKGWMTFGDLNNDGKMDAAVIFGVALDPDGKAVATYLTAVLDVEGKPQPLIPVKVGERIMLNAPLSIRNRQIILPLLTQTEAIDRRYFVKGTTLQIANQ